MCENIILSSLDAIVHVLLLDCTVMTETMECISSQPPSPYWSSDQALGGSNGPLLLGIGFDTAQAWQLLACDLLDKSWQCLRSAQWSFKWFLWEQLFHHVLITLSGHDIIHLQYCIIMIIICNYKSLQQPNPWFVFSALLCTWLAFML